MQGGQKQDNCLTINFVGSAAEKEKIECKLLELGMVAHANGFDRTTANSSICQNFLEIKDFFLLYVLNTRVDSFSVKNCTHYKAFWSSRLGFSRCSFLRAVFTTAPAPSHSPGTTQKQSIKGNF
jgi:hypothetical protein